MFFKYFLLVFFCSPYVAAQPYFTRTRAAFGIELQGITPQGAVIAEAAFGYLNRSFWNVQAGLGAINRGNFRSPTVSGALTHCFILNPYKRNPCVPQPGNYLIEGFLEVGFGGFIVDRYDNGTFSGTNKQRLLTPSGLIGFRFNLLTRKWIYTLKLRYTPPLLASTFASNAGMGISLGWR